MLGLLVDAVPAAAKIQPRPSLDAPKLEKLERCAKLHEGGVRTLVGLAVSDPTSVEERAAASHAVVSKLGAVGAVYSGVQTYTFTSSMSIRADLRGLGALAAMTEVSSLEPDPYTSPSGLRELLLDAQCLGLARVGIRLEMPYRQVRKQDSVQAKRQRQTARTITARVLKGLRRRNLLFKNVRRNRHAPTLELEASRKALDALRHTDDVRRLYVPHVLIPLS